MASFLPDGLGTIDWIVLGFCALLAVRGAFKGFVWQAVRTVGLVGALWLAGIFHADVGAWIDERIAFIPSEWTDEAGWVAILVGVWLVVSMLAWMARGAVRTVDLTGTDRALGFGLGAVMGLAIATIGFTVYGKLTSEERLTETLRDSYAAQGMARLLDVGESLVPAEVRARFADAFDAIRAAAPERTDVQAPHQ